MNKLGFGFLRLPRINPEDEKSVNYELCCELADRFIELGGRYFDTAYTYISGLSETFLRDCVVKRHPREKIQIADKMPTWKVQDKSDLRRFFDEQKARCGVEYFDVYLLHSLNRENYATSEQFDMFAFLREVKKSGEATRIGFSYHDGPELLDEILSAHPCVDVVQLQINYLDWNSPSLQARRLYETAARHGKKVIIMEPVKGGSLASPPAEALARLAAMPGSISPAAWALRFAQSLPEVEVVLSGMNAMAQIEENMLPIEPISAAEEKELLSIADELRKNIAIPCTACAYCTEHCPRSIPIPQYFALYNEYARAPREVWKMQHLYDALAEKFCRAADCAHCGQCQQLCPQRLPIMDWLEKVAVAFGEELEKAVDRVRNSPGVRK